MSIDQYISELLFDYDCVIIPEFGGFISNYAPARIHPTQHIFNPPSKRIVFNTNLKNNDGLLANHISLCEKISFVDATKIISKFVERCNDELKSGNKLIIKNVGLLFFDVERHLQFEPDGSINYLIESFGFSDIHSPAIQRDNYIHGIEKHFKDRPAIPAERPKINVKKYVRLLLAAPLVFAALWIPLKTDLLKRINYSDLNPFAKESPLVPLSKGESQSASVSKGEGQSTSVSLPKGEGQSASVSKGESQSPSATLAKRDLTQQPIKTAVAKVHIKKNKGKRFHVVGGCFKIIENAQRLITQLKSRNIDAAIIGQTNTGLYIVSYGDYASKKQARKVLARIKANNNAEAWLLKANL